MADIRIKDLATTATTTASDDFMAVDGAINGTRKLSAATPAFLTSVTTPTLTSPASTPLTLGTGTSGAAITVLSANNFVGIGTITPGAVLPSSWASSANAKVLEVRSAGEFDSGVFIRASTERGLDIWTDGDLANSYIDSRYNSSSASYGSIFFRTNTLGTPFSAMTIKYNGDTTLASTTAGASNAGALVVTGGISAGAASYFAGAVTVPSLFMSTDAQGSILSSAGNTLFIDAAAGGMTIRPKAGSVFHVSNSAPVRFSLYGAGAATFDSSGNITSVSDARLKNITGTFTKGLAEIVKLTPKLYTWKPESGLVTDDINATLIAQDLIAAGLSEAVATYRTVPVMENDVQSAEDIAAGKPVTQHAKLDADGKAVTQRVDSNYSVSDRTVIAALVNAVKELKAEIDALKAK